MKSGQAAAKNTERHTWLKDSFLQGHIRRKGVSKSSTASVSDTSQEIESEMEISMASNVTRQLTTTSPSHRSAAVTTTTAEDPVLDQFQQIRLMISNYLHSEIEHLEKCDFLTFRNETVKLLSETQYKAKKMQETGHNNSTDHHISTSRSNTGHSRT